MLGRSLRQRTWLSAIPLGLLACISFAAILTTGSKGALLGLVAVAAIACLYFLPRLWRFAILGAGLGAFVAILTLAPVADIPSVSVRLGYWQSAVSLWLQQPWQGIGWGFFGVENAAAMPAWAEWSNRVHNEPLEVLVAAGIPAGLGILALMIFCSFPIKTIRLPYLRKRNSNTRHSSHCGWWEPLSSRFCWEVWCRTTLLIGRGLSC